MLTFLLMAAAGAVAHYLFGFSHADQSGHAWGSDDAYISYRYALNLANGHGLVFNPGEKVEGYTNFLYVLVATIFAMVNPSAIYIGCFIFNVLMFLAALGLGFWYLNRTIGGVNTLLGFAFLCLSPLLWAWPASGLETSTVLLIQLSIFICADFGSQNPSPTAGLFFCCLAGISILIRADGFVFPLICCSAFILRKRWRYGFLAMGVILVFTVLYIAARYKYYGAPFPNTYYAKVSGPLDQRVMSAAKQLIKFCGKTGFFLYLLPLAFGWRSFLAALKSSRRLDLSAAPLIPCIAGGLLAYWFYIGGDVFYERFLLILIPLGVAHLLASDSHPGFVSWNKYAILGIIGLQLTPFALDRRFEYQLKKYDRWIDLGQFLAVRHRDATLAIDAAGKVPFYSGFHTIDILGLNDPHIGRLPVANFNVAGHNKFDADYVLAKRPDLIAAWGNEALDLQWGLTRGKYRSGGYRLKYVVNASSQSKAENIVDVSRTDQKGIAALHKQGYQYLMLMRRPAAEDGNGIARARYDLPPTTHQR
ncbi:MAG: hypothetical protein L0196_02865 [candidate division Zixibacteria bacterium]|nr:hypothetical protein [candidate division Zixibacteria bacterium]